MKLIAALMLIFAGSAHAQSACALRVRVYDPDFRPLDSIPVVIRMDDGRIIGHLRTKNGTAELCDIGWGTFSVMVGQEMCGQVEIRHLYISQINTLEVPVVYRNCHGMMIWSACSVLVRVRGQDGRNLTSATLEIAERPNGTLAPDAFGRIFFGIRFGETVHLSVSARGYASELRELSCTREKPQIEEILDLRPTR